MYTRLYVGQPGLVDFGRWMCFYKDVGAPRLLEQNSGTFSRD